MDSKIQVSIIIPVFNTEKYLKDCLDSIISQDVNKEIIIVNDGSTDDSENIIYKYSKKYQFIKYINQHNQGQGKARNAAIEISSGEYIYFMDSDDTLKQNALSKLYKESKKLKLDAIFFDGESFLDSEVSNQDSEIFTSSYHRNKSYGVFSSGEELLVEQSRNKDFSVSPCLYMIKRNVLIKSQLKFPEGIKHEDEYFSTILMYHLGKVSHINEIFFNRRIRYNSTMTQANKTINFVGLQQVLYLLNKSYYVIDYLTPNGEKAYLNRMELVLRSAMVTHFKINENKPDTKLLLDIAKEHNYFSLTTKIFITLCKNERTFNFLKKIKDKIIP